MPERGPITNLKDVTDRIRYFSARRYWANFRAVTGAERIFYPGVGYDHVLERSFENEKTYYLDENQDLAPRGQNLMYGDINRGLPFKNGSLDVVFVQDIHIELSDKREFLRVLKSGGYIVFSSDDCGKRYTWEIRERQLKDDKHLNQVKFPFSYHHYTAFQKRK